MFGFFNINKPPGPTSHDIVAGVRKLLPREIKVGHAGTLDPFADGVLVLCIGPATRLAEYVQQQTKRYLAELTLGARSSTDDPEGPIVQMPNAAPPRQEQISAALTRFVGAIQQVPPAHSAVHSGGRRAYELARLGMPAELQARQVNIHRIELAGYEYPRLKLDVTCGGGTYIRALARDLGDALGVGGYCSGLTRTQVGPFGLDAAVSLDELDPRRDLLPPLTALPDMPRIVADDEQARRLANGNHIPLPQDIRIAPGEVAILTAEGALLAIAGVDEARGLLVPFKVFVAQK